MDETSGARTKSSFNVHRIPLRLGQKRLLWQVCRQSPGALMATQPYSLFISDLHLQESTPEITRWFLEFLERESGSADALYILGDFFEAWLGDDDYSAYNQQIINALVKAHSIGLKIYIMTGNHDFLLSRGFARMTGAQLMTDPSLIDLYGTPVLLTHGDALCTLDLSYQKLRKWTHNPLMQAIALMAPLSVRRYFAKRMRAKSQSHNGRSDLIISDVTEEAVITEFNKYPSQYMIHGHTHKPKIHTHQLPNGDKLQRIVLDAWFAKANALVWRQNGEFELRYYT